MPIVLLTKSEAKAIQKECKRKRISFSIKPYDEQIYRTKQTGVALKHYSYKVDAAQLKFIRARSRRPLGVKVTTKKYGTRRAFPEAQIVAHKDYMEDRFDTSGHQGVSKYIESTLRLADPSKIETVKKDLIEAMERLESEGYQRKGRFFQRSKVKQDPFFNYSRRKLV